MNNSDIAGRTMETEDNQGPSLTGNTNPNKNLARGLILSSSP